MRLRLQLTIYTLSTFKHRQSRALHFLDRVVINTQYFQIQRYRRRQDHARGLPVEFR